MVTSNASHSQLVKSRSFLLLKDLSLGTDLTTMLRRTMDTRGHSSCNAPAMTQSWHPRKMHIKAEEL